MSKSTIYIIPLFLLALLSSNSAYSQNTPQCYEQAHDNETEMRELGIGKAATAFEALTCAVQDALRKIRPRFTSRYPSRSFEYTLTIDKADESIELDTSIGQPTIVCNDIQASDSIVVNACVVLAVNISNDSTLTE